MPTPVFCCGFECGRIGAAGSTAGEHWIQGGLGAVGSIDTTTFRSGKRSLRINTAGSAGNVVRAVTASTMGVFRFYIYFSSLPSSNAPIFFLTDFSVNIYPGLMYKSNTLYPGHTSSGTITTSGSGYAIVTNRWYRIDIRINTSADPGVTHLSVDGNDVGSHSSSFGASPGTFENLVFGCELGIGETMDFYVDDFIYSNTSADYPYGSGYIHPFTLNADGTHNAGTGIFIFGAAGAAITNATSNTFSVIDEVPLDDTTPDTNDYLNQVANGSTNYLENIFSPVSGIPTPATAPRSVEVIVAYHQSATQSGNSTFKLNDNGTENTILAFSAAGLTTTRYGTKQYATAPTGGAWTVVSGAGNFNNLRHRFGYSSDAAPDQYFDGAMIEAEFAEWPQKITQIKQAVNRSNTY